MNQRINYLFFIMLLMTGSLMSQNIECRIEQPYKNSHGVSITATIRVSTNYPIDTLYMSNAYHDSCQYNCGYALSVMPRSIYETSIDSAALAFRATGNFSLVDDTTLVFITDPLYFDREYIILVNNLHVVISGQSYLAPSQTSYFYTVSKVPELAEVDLFDGTFSPSEGLNFHFTGDFEYSMVNEDVWGYGGPVIEAYLVDQILTDSATLNGIFVETQLQTKSSCLSESRTINMKIADGQLGPDDLEKNVRFKIKTSRLNGDTLTDREAIRKIRNGAIIILRTVDSTGSALQFDGYSIPRNQGDIYIKYGDSLIISATQHEKGFEFSHWEAPGFSSIDNTTNLNVWSMFDASHTNASYSINAVFRSVPALEIAIGYGDNGTVSVYAHDTWTEIGNDDDYFVYMGDTLIVAVNPDPGYGLVDWESDSQLLNGGTEIVVSLDDSYYGGLTYLRPHFELMDSAPPPEYGSCNVRAVVMPDLQTSNWYELFPTGGSITADANGKWNAGLDVIDYSKSYRIQAVSYNTGSENQIIHLNNLASHRIYLDATEYQGTIVYYLEPVRYTVIVEKELLNSQNQATSNNELYRQLPVRLQNENVSPIKTYRNMSSDPKYVVINDVSEGEPVSIFASGIRNTSMAFDYWDDTDGRIVPPATNPPTTYDLFTFSISADEIAPGETARLKAVYKQSFNLESVEVVTRKYDATAGAIDEIVKIDMGSYSGGRIYDCALNHPIGYAPPTSTFELLLNFSDPVDMQSITKYPSSEYNLFATDRGMRLDYTRMNYQNPNSGQFQYVPQVSGSGSPLTNIYSPGTSGKTVAFELVTWSPLHGNEFPNGVCPTRMLPILLNILSGNDGVKSSIGSTLPRDIELMLETIGPGIRVSLREVHLEDDCDNNSSAEVIYMNAGAVYSDGQHVLSDKIEKRIPDAPGSYLTTNAPWDEKFNGTPVQFYDVPSIGQSYKISLSSLAYDLDCGHLQTEATDAITSGLGSALTAAMQAIGVKLVDITTPLSSAAASKANDIYWYCGWFIDPDDYIGSAEWHLYKESLWGTYPSAANPSPLKSGIGKAEFTIDVQLVY